MATKRWKCSVCGYIHMGDEAPEKCPACGVDKTMFFQVDEDGKRIDSKYTEKAIGKPPEATSEQGGTGLFREETSSVEEVASPVMESESPSDEEPGGIVEEVQPEEVTEEKKVEKPAIEVPAKKPDIEAIAARTVAKETEPAPEAEPAAAEKEQVPEKKKSRSFIDLLGALVLKLHLHPIAVHTPNGVLPMAVLFMVLAIFFNYPIFEQPAFFSLTFVLAILPVVVLTGYLEWQLRYRGAKTFLFIVKIFCSLVVLVTVSTLVIWRFIDPGVAGPESPFRMIYLGVGGGSLVAAGIAGHLGGKLVFAGR